MPLRVALAGIQHETNSYCAHTTPLDAFQVARGEEVLRARNTRTFVGGMLAGAESLGAQVVPLLVSGATPSGVIESGAWSTLRDAVLDGLYRAGPFDAVALALHGAAIAQGIDDAEVDLCERVRAAVGPAVPVVASFDLHANLTQTLVDTLDLALLCREYPHVDTFERGREALLALPHLVERRWRPALHVERLPLLLPSTTTFGGAAAEVNARCAEQRARPGMLDCAFAHGFPFADVPRAGASVCAVADGDRELARDAARAVARFVWQTRAAFTPDTLPCAVAVARALALDGGPIVIAETSDNPGGGAPGDGTHLLRALLDAKLERACFGFICDPDVARLAHRAGVGAKLDVALGGKLDPRSGPPLPLRAEVAGLTDGRFVLREMLAGVAMNLGPMARLRAGGLDILVSSRAQQTFDDEVFRAHGIDVRNYKIVALKGSHHFRAGFRELARGIVTADGPGLTTQALASFARSRTRRPIWPLDADARYPSE
jgi:microcystin degradation protein MlrC